MNPILQNLSIEDFNYYLPPEKIAQFPLENRDEAKLLVFNLSQSKIEHTIFKHLPDIIDDSWVIVRNNTKVFPARFYLKKPSGGTVEVLIEAPQNIITPERALNSLPPQNWLCIMRGKNLKPGLILEGKFSDTINLKAEIVEIRESKRLVAFNWEPADLSLSELLQEIGKIPLPEYINREPMQLDKYAYQTVFAKNEGSIAAPTAGLHFTEKLNKNLQDKGVEIFEITLHVGSGTFVPLKTNVVFDHKMHSEQFHLTLEFLKQLQLALSNHKKIIATGTTTVRTLESLYWIGCVDEIDIHNPKVPQWLWNESQLQCSSIDAINNLIKKMENNGLSDLVGETQLMIVPGYDYKIVNAIITNFHLPKSTLLLLVAAFIGREKMLEIYNEALEKNYRFLSYGDATLLIR